MTLVLTVAQQKGGVGKSTLAAHFAVAYSKQGLDVALVDADPQGTLSTWYDRRFNLLGEDAHSITFNKVPSWRLTSVVQRLNRSHDLIIIDNAPGMDSDSKNAMRLANLVVVPVQPSPADVWSTHAVLEFASEENLPLMLVMNRVTARSRMALMFRKKLPFLANTQLGNRIAFSICLKDGLTVQEMAPDSVAAKEFRSLLTEVSRKLALKKIRSNAERKEKEHA
jgi:chromosome partitioning protein